MTLRDIHELAIESFRLHRMRTALTLLGIAIGVTAVLLLTALGDAAKEYVVRQFAGIGTNLVIALPGRVETSGMPTAGGTTRDLTLEDAEAIRRQAPAVRDVAPLSLGSASFAYSGRTRDGPGHGDAPRRSSRCGTSRWPPAASFRRATRATARAWW